jgi:hypothetical protein
MPTRSSDKRGSWRLQGRQTWGSLARPKARRALICAARGYPSHVGPERVKSEVSYDAGAVESLKRTIRHTKRE